MCQLGDNTDDKKAITAIVVRMTMSLSMKALHVVYYTLRAEGLSSGEAGENRFELGEYGLTRRREFLGQGIVLS